MGALGFIPLVDRLEGKWTDQMQGHTNTHAKIRSHTNTLMQISQVIEDSIKTPKIQKHLDQEVAMAFYELCQEMNPLHLASFFPEETAPENGLPLPTTEQGLRKWQAGIVSMQHECKGRLDKDNMYMALENQLYQRMIDALQKIHDSLSACITRIIEKSGHG